MFIQPVLAEILSVKTNLRLVSELFSSFHVSRPTSLVQVKSRVTYNFHRFYTNYIAIFVTLAIYSLLANWKLLVEMILVAIVLLVTRVDQSSNDNEQRQYASSHVYILYVIAFLVILRSSLLATLLSIACTSSVLVVAHASLIERTSMKDN